MPLHKPISIKHQHLLRPLSSLLDISTADTIQRSISISQVWLKSVARLTLTVINAECPCNEETSVQSHEYTYCHDGNWNGDNDARNMGARFWIHKVGCHSRRWRYPRSGIQVVLHSGGDWFIHRGYWIFARSLRSRCWWANGFLTQSENAAAHTHGVWGLSSWRRYRAERRGRILDQKFSCVAALWLRVQLGMAINM